MNDICIIITTISLAIMAIAKVIDMIADIESAIKVEQYIKADKVYNISKQQEEQNQNNRVTISMPFNKTDSNIDFPNSNH